MSIFEIIMAIVMVFQLLLTFALISRIRVIQENRVPTDPDLPAPGDVVKPFEVISTEGIKLSDRTLATGATLVGFFSPQCGPCEKARVKLLDNPPGLPMLAFIEGSEDDAASRHIGTTLGQIARVAYTASNDSVTRAFRQAGFPTFVRVESGVVKSASHSIADVLA